MTSIEYLRRLLDSGAELTSQHLQDQLNLSERHVRRLIGQLRDEGLPILERPEGNRKVYALPTERQQSAVSDLRFDSAELRALAIAAKASRSVLTGTPHAVALNRAFEKLLDKARPVSYVFDLDDSMQEWQFDDNATDQIALDLFSSIETAMDNRQCIRINYFTAQDQRNSTARKIDPYGFHKRGRAWLLVAWCHERNALRNFSLTRISRVDACSEEYFDIPDDFIPEDYFRASLGAINSGACEELRLLIEPDKAIYFRERLYHPTQQIEEDRPDGRLVVSYELEGFEEMRSFCQGWGVGITVLEPETLRQRLREEAEALVKRYQA
ncbi:helix-turn-helix transcriptional regulator [Fibrella rubiginis]|nr:WYL domain-containing transcriptional regulator [Fibrella rubiginis]